MSRRRWLTSLAMIAGTVVIAAGSAYADDSTRRPAGQPVFERGVVAADHPLASQAGLEMLQKGGNVVDAAVATSFALSVVRPESCGIGGGGFMVIWDARSQSAVTLDYRERAPANASATMFLSTAERPLPPKPSQFGGLACGIPGNVAGLCYALEKYGTLDLPTVLAPAIRIAREGHVLDRTAVRNRQESLADLDKIPNGHQRFAHFKRLYLNGGAPLKEGERVTSPLVDVLERIAREGPEGFYRGEVGAALVEEVRRQGGIWTPDDLDSTRMVVVRDPLRMTYGRSELLTMPPPSSGGIALIETLQILAAGDAAHPEAPLASLGHNSPAYVHRVAEALKHAFADRATYLGDADFVTVPVKSLTSADYARRLAAKFDPLHTHPPEFYGRSFLPDDAGTSHLSVIDQHGNAVACTETINLTYGSFVVEPRFGVILNNEMDDFTAEPGKPNAFGLMQSEQNAVAPGKKPLSSMTPTILVQDGKAVLAVGASGGPRIITGTLQGLLNVTQFEMSPAEAVAAPRFHHQWQPAVLSLERPLLNPLEKPLQERGHEIGTISNVAVVQAVTRSADGLRAASDPRKGGQPAGF